MHDLVNGQTYSYPLEYRVYSFFDSSIFLKSKTSPHPMAVIHARYELEGKVANLVI